MGDVLVALYMRNVFFSRFLSF